VTLPLLTPSGRCGINGPFAWRHRPMYTAKETYLYGKRDLLTPAFAHASSAPPACARARVRVRMCMCSCVHMCVCVCVCASVLVRTVRSLFRLLHLRVRTHTVLPFSHENYPGGC